MVHSFLQVLKQQISLLKSTSELRALLDRSPQARETVEVEGLLPPVVLLDILLCPEVHPHSQGPWPSIQWTQTQLEGLEQQHKRSQLI